MIPLNECPDDETKQSDDEFPVMLELWGMWSSPSLLSPPGSLESVVVGPDRVLSKGQIEMFVKLYTDAVFTFNCEQTKPELLIN